VAGSCEYGDETLGSGATELVSKLVSGMGASQMIDKNQLNCSEVHNERTETKSDRRPVRHPSFSNARIIVHVCSLVRTS
jgi:hypothetical protein